MSFPLGVFTAVTGVSGSGKSTLVNDILYASLARSIYNARTVPGRHTKVTGLDARRQGRPRRPEPDRPDTALQPSDVHRGLRPCAQALRE